MQRYNSKIDLWILIPLFVVLGGSIIFLIINKEWISLIINLFVSLFVFVLFTSTYYIIDTDKLIIKSSFIINIKININKIISIKETRNPLSSPALSLDRLIIKYNNGADVMISPKNKTKFIEHLLKINPEINVVYKS